MARPDYECEHGRLRVACDQCALIALTADNERLRGLLREARSDLRLWCDAYESPQDTLRLIQRINAVLGKGE